MKDAIRKFFSRRLSGRRVPDTLPSLEFVASLLRNGQSVEAEAWCRRILQAFPGHTEALLLQAEIAFARGSEPAFRRALEHAESQKVGDNETLCRIGALYARIGDHDNAARLYGRALEIDRHSIGMLRNLAEAEEEAGRIDSARLLYDTVLAAWPDSPRAYTRRAVMLMRQAWGAPLPSPADKRQEAGLGGRIMMSQLGEKGRFGNQLAQYTALRVYGRVHRLRVEVPEWAGRWLFDLDDPYPAGGLPVLQDQSGLMAKAMSGQISESFAGRDFSGYFFCPPHLYRPHRDFIRTLFRPGEHVRPRLEAAMARLRRRGRTLVALHIRRGDKVDHDNFWVAPEQWYLEWLDRIWNTLDAPVLYIASDDPRIFQCFDKFAPLGSTDAGEEIPGAEFFIDFHVLSQADILVLSPSSFSSTAARLNQRATLFMRPSSDDQCLVSFDPWETAILSWRPSA